MLFVKKEYECEMDKMFAKTIGVICAIGFVIIMGLFMNGAINLVGYGVDDSDQSAFNRSGLSVHTDAKTGLQYFSTSSGGALIPRIDSDGNHMRE